MIGYSIPRLEETRVLFHCGHVDGSFITMLEKRLAKTSWPCPLLLLRDFEDDVEFYWHPERKAGNADHQPNRCFFDAKDISKQVRDCIRDPRLVVEVPVRRYKHSQPDDA